MFTQRCFIRENDEDLINKVLILGNRTTKFINKDYNIIIATPKIVMCGDTACKDDDYVAAMGFIDCGTNEELFLAIAALRDDSDKHQLFTNGKEWIQCEKEDWIDEISSLCVGGRYNYDKNGELSVDFHKATVEELIKHFAV